MKKTIFFIVMGVSVIALTAYLGIQLIVNNLPDDTKNGGQDIVKVNVPEKVNPVEAEEKTEKVPEPIIKVEEKEEAFAMIYPVNGEIGLGYSPSDLVYSKTLKEWTVHNGIDIIAKRGTPVVAAEKGTVENITETAGNGIEMVISHENGYKTIYANLSSKDMVKVGDKVEKGQVISGVGNTSSFEYYEPEHLHFEVKKDGKLMDPIKVLTK